MAIQEKTLCQAVMRAFADDIYTAPSKQTTIIKYIRVVNITGTSGQFRLYIREPGAMLGNQHIIMPMITLAGQKMYSEPCFMALEEGWQLLAESNAEDRMVITVWGALVG